MSSSSSRSRGTKRRKIREEYFAEENGDTNNETGAVAADDDDEDNIVTVKNPSSPAAKKETSVTVDLDLLECIVCFLPLRSPLFQCQNGHVACSPCCHKLQNKCPNCRLSTNYSRCLALEKLLESIKVPCSNDGCEKNLPYADLHKHEDICIYAPCDCPISYCTFVSSIVPLSAHVDDCHKDAVKHLKNGLEGFVSIERNERFCVVRVDNHKELFLLVNHFSDASTGNALSMICICPQSWKHSFLYELEVYNENGSSLKLQQAPMTSVKRWMGSAPADIFLLVPQKFTKGGSIWVHIEIKIGNVVSLPAKETTN